MIADEIGVATASVGDATTVRVGALLINMALRADPVYTAELAYLCGASVWKEVGGTLAKRLRAMYGVAILLTSRMLLGVGHN